MVADSVNNKNPLMKRRFATTTPTNIPLVVVSNIIEQEDEKKIDDDVVEQSPPIMSSMLIVNSLRQQTNKEEKSKITVDDEIRATYSTNYNIVALDLIIRKKIKDEVNGINDLIERITVLQRQVISAVSIIEAKYLSAQIKVLENQLEDLKDDKKLNRYIEQSTPYIDAYKSMKVKTRTFIFSLKGTEEEKDDENTIPRLICIEDYLNVAKDYANINITRRINPKAASCRECDNLLTEDDVNEMGITQCSYCMSEYNTVVSKSSEKDGIYSKASSSTADDTAENFKRAIVRYQGLQNIKIPDKLYVDLDKYFNSRGRVNNEEIKKLPLNERGRRGDTNCKMLFSALKDIGSSKYYEDVNLIGHKYWGWELPNISHLVDQIMSDYHKTQIVYYNMSVSERERSSSLGTQYRLWRHLQLRGHECYVDEFKLPDNQESLATHNRVWRIMCQRAEDANIYYIE